MSPEVTALTGEALSCPSWPAIVSKVVVGTVLQWVGTRAISPQRWRSAVVPAGTVSELSDVQPAPNAGSAEHLHQRPAAEVTRRRRSSSFHGR